MVELRVFPHLSFVSTYEITEYLLLTINFGRVDQNQFFQQLKIASQYWKGFLENSS